MKIFFRIISMTIILISIVSASFSQAHPTAASLPSNHANFGQAYNPWRSEYIQRSLDPPLHVGYFPSLALRPSDDIAYVSYYNQTEGDLMIANRLPFTDCGEYWHCFQMTDPQAIAGQFTSTDLWSQGEEWKLGVSYYNATNHSLQVYLTSCDTSSCYMYYITVNTPPDNSNIYIGRYTSLKFQSNGQPLIVYQKENYAGVDSLMYAYPVTSGGNCGEGDYLNQWMCLTIDTGEGIGRYASLDLSWDQKPYVAYYDAINGNLKLAAFVGTGGNCGTGNYWICGVVDGQDGSNVGLFASLKAPSWNGAPLRIAYYDVTNRKLKFYNSLAVFPMFVDDMGIYEVNMGISLDIDKDGLAVIAYEKIVDQQTHRELRLARPYLAFNDGSFGNCGDPLEGDLYWRCSTLDSGTANTRVAEFVSLAIDSRGLARIAYSELDAEFNITSLKYTYQMSMTLLPFLTKQ